MERPSSFFLGTIESVGEGRILLTHEDPPAILEGIRQRVSVACAYVLLRVEGVDRRAFVRFRGSPVGQEPVLECADGHLSIAGIEQNVPKVPKGASVWAEFDFIGRGS
jgi:hypothetical protein